MVFSDNIFELFLFFIFKIIILKNNYANIKKMIKIETLHIKVILKIHLKT